mmetsp:Transcript_16565/g.28528  ORF Transcript_16565/g.28528 Transcript_16565/m.28528 type:complete len:371 (-) Transcript_16565:99-1211(-)
MYVCVCSVTGQGISVTFTEEEVQAATSALPHRPVRATRRTRSKASEMTTVDLNDDDDDEPSQSQHSVMHEDDDDDMADVGGMHDDFDDAAHSEQQQQFGDDNDDNSNNNNNNDDNDNDDNEVDDNDGVEQSEHDDASTSKADDFETVPLRGRRKAAQTAAQKIELPPANDSAVMPEVSDVSDWSDVNLDPVPSQQHKARVQAARQRSRLFPTTYSRKKSNKTIDSAVLDDLYGFKTSKERAAANKSVVMSTYAPPYQARSAVGGGFNRFGKAVKKFVNTPSKAKIELPPAQRNALLADWSSHVPVSDNDDTAPPSKRSRPSLDNVTNNNNTATTTTANTGGSKRATRGTRKTRSRLAQENARPDCPAPTR